MIITFRRTAICQSVAEVWWLTGVAPLGAVIHRYNFYTNSAVVKHVVEQGRRIDWEGATCLEKEK